MVAVRLEPMLSSIKQGQANTALKLRNNIENLRNPESLSKAWPSFKTAEA